MRILVLGGTQFIGRHFVEQALAVGHEVTLFHRGRRGAELFPEVERVLGDRDGGLDGLGERAWDAVVDTSGYVPRVVRQSASRLRDRTARYLFVSTISVYDDPDATEPDESSRLADLADPATEEVTGETYGGLKVLCEREVEGAFGERSLIVRPGLVAGPYDPTNRFTYWVDRFAEGGSVLAPDRDEAPLQLIDARDLAAFMLHGLEAGLHGPYNAAGPASTFGEMLRILGELWPEARPVRVPEAVLEGYGVTLWQDLPLALPGSGEGDALMRTRSDRARAAGLQNRPLAQTALETRAWSGENPPEEPVRHGMSRDREREALARWAASSPNGAAV
jgi:2'-hydroxyisoflavone reductase